MIELTGPQENFRNEVARFATEEIAPHATAWDTDDRYPVELFAHLGELGWLGVGFDETVGGSGGEAVERCLLIEELARASAGVALGIYVHTALAAGALAEIAAQDLRDRFLPDLLAGHLTGAWAYAEPDAGADVTRARLTARRDGDRYTLDGSKMYITNGTFADVILVVVRTGLEPGRLRGLSVLAVDGDTPGLTRTPMAKVGMRPSELAELHFDGVEVPTDRLVGDEETGFRQCLAVLSKGRIFGGALAVGLAGAALDASASHVVGREQFGGPLAELQAVRFTLADMTARLRAARTLVYGSAAAMAADRDFDTDASIAKLTASETATYVCERAMHLHGAQGFMSDSPVQRYYRDCKILEYGEGANEVQREMIAKALVLGYRP
ncbi:MAG: acyl-CoA dehydrogenase family protein [Acidimicrobiia bacterium]